MKKQINKADNFLELVPKRDEDLQWETKEDGLVEIIIPRQGLLDKIVRLFFKTPKAMKIALDDVGTCVWKAIDGERNIEKIAEILKKEFGKDAEPLYQRLGTYINILRNNNFIILQKESD